MTGSPVPEGGDGRLARRLETVLRADLRARKAYPVADATGLVKLDLMENPFGLPAPLQLELARALAGLALNRYPEPRPASLLAAIRERLGVPAAAGLMLGNGSDELIGLIAVAVARPGAKILAPVPTFVMYETAARQAQLEFVPVPLAADFTLDLDAMLSAIEKEQPAVVYLSYPNNPTGTLYPRAAVAAILEHAPGLVVVDEAYQPFAADTWMPQAAQHDNLIVMRTLSKSGLAGVRLGYMAGRPEWIDEFDKVRPPFNVNVLTQCCVEFVLRHKDVLDAQAQILKQQRELLARALAPLPGVTVFPSEANFLLLRIASSDPDAASRVFEGIRARGVLIKNLSAAHPLLANALRVTVSSADENARFLEALSASLPLAAPA